MKYEEKLQKLRDAGVIDMTLSFGCKIRDKQRDRIYTYRKIFPRGGDASDEERYSFIESNLALDPYICEILGHDLLYGRVCRWIEEKYRNIKCPACGSNLYYCEEERDEFGRIYLDAHWECPGKLCPLYEIDDKGDKDVEDAINKNNEDRCCDLDSLFSIWHRKDLPLSQQENKEEIVDFIISLLSSK